MMERLDEIVEEVLRRLKRYRAEKRVLLILRDDSDFGKVKQMTELLENVGYTMVVCSLLVKDVKVLEDPVFGNRENIRTGIFREMRYEDFLKRFHGVVISDLHFEECRELLNMRFRDALGKIVFETVKENKPVYAFSREMTGVKNEYLRSRMEPMKEELREMRIHLLTEGWISDSAGKGSLKEKPEMGEKDRGDTDEGQCSGKGILLPHRFITLSDVNTIGEKEILVSEQAKLTMEASDYVRRHGISIRRRRKSD
ncbi:hypothetical protein ACHAL6_05390 [Proteiniclasticum sp. C24MP]|uniref:hypothetical protein n=1 Tax=Proteiniclasticum sp. C24MP TaxID=3374101 RepID=UPI0037546ACD